MKIQKKIVYLSNVVVISRLFRLVLVQKSLTKPSLFGMSTRTQRRKVNPKMREVMNLQKRK